MKFYSYNGFCLAEHGGRVPERATAVSEPFVPLVFLVTRNPKTIRADELAVTAVEKMETLKINGLLVVDAHDTLVGALNMHALLQAGVV